MKVFISWSGDLSLKVAEALYDWLPMVLQAVKPYISSKGIDSGARWNEDIAKELEDTSFGIICVTKDNQKEPWLNYEAGALSKFKEAARVCPFLFNLERAELKDGPLLQFQNTTFEETDIKKLVQSINSKNSDNPLSDKRLDESFDLCYERIKASLDDIRENEIGAEDQTTEHEPALVDIKIDEILTLSRGQIFTLNQISHLLNSLDRKIPDPNPLTFSLADLAMTGVGLPSFGDLLRRTRIPDDQELDLHDIDSKIISGELEKKLKKKAKKKINKDSKSTKK